MKCPGQDRRYWAADAVAEMPCPRCGSAVEIFKDESSGRCARCGYRFLNPGADFGCAQWCAMAEQCVGPVPQAQSSSGAGNRAPAARLIEGIEEAIGQDQARLARALRAFQYAKELAAKEGGDPRVALAAALLLEIGFPDSELLESSGGPVPECGALFRANVILDGSGLDAESRRQVWQILQGAQPGNELRTVEHNIAWDCYRLTRLAEVYRDGPATEAAGAIASRLQTEAAKQKAGDLLGNIPARTQAEQHGA
jgi:hypothetical protein